MLRYYKDGYREEHMFETASTSSHGSRGSDGSSVYTIELGLTTRNTVYFA